MSLLTDALADARAKLDAFEGRVTRAEQGFLDELHSLLGDIHADVSVVANSAAPIPVAVDVAADPVAEAPAESVGSGYQPAVQAV
jgi:hypothetical protein